MRTSLEAFLLPVVPIGSLLLVDLLGAWAVSETLFSAMVVVSLLSCMPAPIGMRAAFRGVESA